MAHLSLRLRLVDGTPTPILNPRATAAAILDRGPEALTYKLVDAEWDPPARPTRDEIAAALVRGSQFSLRWATERQLTALTDAVMALVHGDPTPDLSDPET